MDFLDLTVLCVFLLLTLGIGAYAGRGITDIKAYAVGGRSYGTFALLATLSASYIGGGYTFGVSEKSFSSGMVYSLCLLGFSLQLFLVSRYIAPKMSRFYQAYSVGDIMATFYGETGRLITGISSAIVCAGIIGAQVKATGYVFNLFLGVDPMLGILIGCGIVIAYAVFGGIKAVVATDILQFLVLIVMIPLTLFISVYELGGIEAMLSKLPPMHTAVPGKMGGIAMLSVFLSLLLGEALVPPYVQRLFIAKDTKTTSRGTLISCGLSIPFFLAGGAIGLVAFALNPELNANMSLPYVIDTMLPVGLKGLAVAGIIACIMSSADSYLNAAAIAVIHDLVRPLKKNDLTSGQELHLTRLCTLLIGVFSVVFAIYIESAMDILLYSYNFWSPIILIPLVMGIVGYQLNTRGFLLSSFSGVLGTLGWTFSFEGITGIDGLVAGVITHAIVFLVLWKREPQTPPQV